MISVEPRPGAAKPDPILVVDGLHRQFGGLVAVDVDHLEIQRNTITALIGPNGAGKTTCFNQLTGFDRPDSGRWVFDGKDLSRRSAPRIARAGMVRTFQLTKALARMSVLDNMRLGATDQPGETIRRGLIGGWQKRDIEITERADQLLARFTLDAVRDDYAATLSGGQRKLLEMARALMARPAMLMLDEPIAGVNPALVESILAHIEALRDDDVTILFVEHNMDAVMGISDWVVVLAEGSVIAEGPPQVVGRDERVIEAYLGRGPGVGADQ